MSVMQIFYPRHIAGEFAAGEDANQHPGSSKSILSGRSSLGPCYDATLPAFAQRLLAEAQAAAVPGAHGAVSEVIEAAVTLMGSTQAQLEDMTNKYGAKLVC